MVKQKSEKIGNYNNINAELQDITKPNNPVITDSKLKEKEVEDNSQIIKTFVQYCNEKKVEEAYNMLTDDCKSEVYGTIDAFEASYINQIFLSEKSYKLELWANSGNYYTYRITYIEGNILQTGGYNSGNDYVDYITIVKKGNEFKLNINQFIKKENINKSQKNSNIEITINTRTVYLNYEYYNINIKNNTNKTILFNDGKNAKNIYLQDTNGIQYISLINELATSILTIEPQYAKTFNLKFNKIYNEDIKVENMQINNIYLDKEKYDLNFNDETLERINVTIDL